MIHLPPFAVSRGDRLKAVVRPESVTLSRLADPRAASRRNVFRGRVVSGMYIGSIMRYKISVGPQIVYVDDFDPQYGDIFSENDEALLLLKEDIHLLSA